MPGLNFHLGLYSDFIWPAYAVTALALGALTVWTALAFRAARKKLAALEDARNGGQP